MFVKSGSIYLKRRSKWSATHSTHIVKCISSAEMLLVPDNLWSVIIRDGRMHLHVLVVDFSCRASWLGWLTDDIRVSQSAEYCDIPSQRLAGLPERNAGDTRSRNLYQKLVPVVSRLVSETCTCVGQSGNSFFSGTSFLHAIEHSSKLIAARKLPSTWHEPCNVIGRRVVSVQETVMNLRQFLVQVTGTSFWYKFCERVSVAWAQSGQFPINSCQTRTFFGERHTGRYVNVWGIWRRWSLGAWWSCYVNWTGFNSTLAA